MQEWGSLLKNIRDLGAAASIIGAVLGILASIAASWASFRRKTPEPPDPHANLEDLTRIDEVRDALRRNDSIARWAGRSNGFLVFTQVVIGGVLATSFVQGQLRQSTVGFLGVLVLVSSLVHQQFRPDLKYRGARRRVAKLTALLRQAEDGVFEIQQDKATAPRLEVLRRYVTRQLSQIEQTEVDEMPGDGHIEFRQLGIEPEKAEAIPVVSAQPAVAADLPPADR